ncbi:MAG TPA: hypothetical protein ENF43_01240 [Thermoplasmatales archaeon]|nr:hypothetical protein [Thermoplasmatales archaeon]
MEKRIYQRYKRLSSILAKEIEKNHFKGAKNAACNLIRFFYYIGEDKDGILLSEFLDTSLQQLATLDEYYEMEEEEKAELTDRFKDFLREMDRFVNRKSKEAKIKLFDLAKEVRYLITKKQFEYSMMKRSKKDIPVTHD